MLHPADKIYQISGQITVFIPGTFGIAFFDQFVEVTAAGGTFPQFYLFQMQPVAQEFLGKLDAVEIGAAKFRAGAKFDQTAADLFAVVVPFFRAHRDGIPCPIAPNRDAATGSN